MRHGVKVNRLSRSRAQRKALIRSLLRAVIINERIKTTEAKAKVLRSWVDRLITWAKRGDIHARRLSYSLLGDYSLVKKLFDSIGPRFKDINGGYTRVLDLGRRKGDDAKISIFELTKQEEKKKIEKKEKKSKKEASTESSEEVFESKDKKDSLKQQTAKKSVASGMRKIFKKGRSSE